MPLYEYRCDACAHRFEVIQRFSDDPIAVCPSCGEGPVLKLLSSPAIQFKGTGWYITDYARKGKDGGDSKAPGTKPEGTSDTAAKPQSADTSSTSSAPTTSKD